MFSIEDGNIFCIVNGGKSDGEVIFVQDNIDKDLMQNYIAVWHDESHLNHYFIYNKRPSTILSPSYCYPSHFPEYITKHPCNPKLLALVKNHTEYQK